jgi:hypothetical protein
METFKDIPNYEGIYQVSDLGNVKSLARVKLNRGLYPQNISERILKQTLNSRGYLGVTLCLNGFFEQHQIHMLVACTFLNHIPDGTNKIVVDHINEIKTDNRLINLQLITHSKNIAKSNSRILPTGVTFDKRKNKYQARIKKRGIQKHLGLFTTPEEASEVYQNEYLKLYSKNQILITEQK